MARRNSVLNQSRSRILTFNGEGLVLVGESAEKPNGGI